MTKAKRRKPLRSAAALLKTLREGPRLGDDDLEDALTYAAAGDDKITPVIAELVKNDKDLRSHVGSRMIRLQSAGHIAEAVVGARLAMAGRSLDGVAATTALLLAWTARDLVSDGDRALWLQRTKGAFIKGQAHRTRAWAQAALAAGDVDAAREATRALIVGALAGTRRYADELGDLVDEVLADKAAAKQLGAALVTECKRACKRAAKAPVEERSAGAVKKGRWRG